MRRMVAMTGRDLFGPGYQPTTWNYPESVGYTAEEVDAVRTAIKTDRVFWYCLEAYPETGAAMTYLAERMGVHNDDVYFITARPGLDAKRQTEMWLRKEMEYVAYYRIPPAFPTVLISSHKGLCAQALELDVYIDDRWENAVDVASRSMVILGEKPACRSCLLTRPWNTDFTLDNPLGYAEALGITRVSALPGICD